MTSTGGGPSPVGGGMMATGTSFSYLHFNACFNPDGTVCQSGSGFIWDKMEERARILKEHGESDQVLISETSTHFYCIHFERKSKRI